jgi:CRISPR/Cas system-associated exonuclease Cas4 (RecB family)
MTNVKRFNYTDTLGWSVSRFDKFLTCKRQYFYDYYAKYDRDTPIEKLNFLKKLTSKALETGNIVHDCLRDLLKRYQKSSSPINQEKFQKYVFDMTQKYCSKTFSESYYGNDLIDPQDIFTKVTDILQNFFESQRFKWIEKNAKLTSADWVIEPDGFGETRINNLKAYCKVDFLFPMDDKLYILDWKTGKPSLKKHTKQLTGYSVWANYHFNKPVKDIVPIIVYLYPNYDEKTIEVDEKIIEDFSKQVEEEIKEMYAYLQDIDRNIPKDKAAFATLENRMCNYCNYRELCKQN